MKDEQLIQEIGELFGQFKTQQGDFVSFASQIGPRINTPSGSTADFYGLPDAVQKSDSFKSPFFKGPLMEKFRWGRYYGWQKDVINELQRGKDVYIVAPPGGGKTTPLMAYWFVNLFLGGKDGDIHKLDPNLVVDQTKIHNTVINKWSNIFYSLLHQKTLSGQPVSGVLFITPIRVLAYEQAEGFQEILLDLLIFLKSLFVYIDPNDFTEIDSTGKRVKKPFQKIIQEFHQDQNSTLKRIIANVFEGDEKTFDVFRISDDDKNQIREFDTFVRNLTYKFICVKTGGAGGGDASFNTSPESATIVIATYGSAKNFINRIVNTVKLIVYDEAHLYQPLNEQGASQNEKTAASDAYQIIQAVGGAPSNVQVTFLSGTINPISAENFAEYLNKKFHRSLVVASTKPGDPEAINKTQLRVIPDDSLMNEESIVRMASQWITNQESGNAIILFSKTRINQLTQKIMRRVAPSNLNDISNRGPMNRAQKEELARYERALKVVNPNISKDELDQQMLEFQKKNFPSKQSDIIERIKNKPGANRIENSDLRTAVAYGIGYIYRQDEDSLSSEDKKLGKQKISENDKRIVADLFSKGKIYVLLATPSIGVGVNVSIRNMYLPTVEKFESDGGFGGRVIENNKREMSQLLNRAGRGITPISGIYTPKQFVNYLEDIVMMGNTDHPEVGAIPIEIRSTEDLLNVLIRLNRSVSRETIKAYYSTKSTITSASGSSAMLRFRLFMRETIGRRIAMLQNSKAQEDNIEHLMQNHFQKIDQLIQRTEYELNSIQRTNQFMTNPAEKVKTFDSGLKKRQDLIYNLQQSLNDLTEIRNKVIVQRSQLPSYKSLLERMDSKRVEVWKLCTKIENLTLDYLVDGYILITDTLDALQQGPSNWQERQKSVELNNILHNNYLDNKEKLKKNVESSLKRVQEDIKTTYDLLRTLTRNKTPNSPLSDLEKNLSQLHTDLLKYRDNLKNKLTNEIPKLKK